ncbi:MAG: MiaB/RimO family radical SAM methylthiotransferase [Phycisphaerales bacterium]|nr:MiaB/RimO family radical SAM methylthiotransferase [Phycisphaerales bacterium]
MTSVFLETFGCQMNELDSELVAGQLRAIGYQFVDRPEEAEIVLYNTCSVREQAEQKALSRIGLVGVRKRAGERVILGVIGCMAERDGTDIFRRHPQVDFLCGPGELDKLPHLIDSARRADLASHEGATERPSLAERAALSGNKSRRSTTLAAAEDNLESLDLSRAFDPETTGQPRHRAYVRITRGCNKFCTYCVVPNTRGAEVHRPPQHVIDECRKLVDLGVKEITLLGQTVNHYRYQHGVAVTASGEEAAQVGPGLSVFRARGGAGTTTFADLLRRIHDEIPDLARLRFVTSYPRDFGDDILEAMRDSARICRYLHAPAQSGSDRILRLMNRGYSVNEYIDFVDRAFTHLPDATLAGDFIVGFPTETDEDFAATCDLVRRLPFKNNFIFKYSPRPGTSAFSRLADDVPDPVKRARNNALLSLQSEVSAAVHAQLVGSTQTVLIDDIRTTRSSQRGRNHIGLITVNGASVVEQASVSQSDSVSAQFVGRTSGDIIVAMDCDSSTDFGHHVGELASVFITRASPLLLHGRLSVGGPTASS